MKAKKGKKVNPVKPLAPEKPFEADAADPGQVARDKTSQVDSNSGKYGSEEVKPFKTKEASESEAEKEQSWIEFEVLDDDDNPVPGVKYELTLPDGSVSSGVVDNKGLARVEGFDPGECSISFPDLEQDAWEPA